MAFLLTGLCFLLEPEGKIICWEWRKMSDLRVGIKFWNKAWVRRQEWKAQNKLAFRKTSRKFTDSK